MRTILFCLQKYIFVSFAYKYSRKQTQFDLPDTVSLIYPFLNVLPRSEVTGRGYQKGCVLGVISICLIKMIINITLSIIILQLGT